MDWAYASLTSYRGFISKGVCISFLFFFFSYQSLLLDGGQEFGLRLFFFGEGFLKLSLSTLDSILSFTNLLKVYQEEAANIRALSSLAESTWSGRRCIHQSKHFLRLTLDGRSESEAAFFLLSHLGLNFFLLLIVSFDEALRALIFFDGFLFIKLSHILDAFHDILEFINQ